MRDFDLFRVSLDPLPPAGLRVRLERVRWTDASFQLLAFLNLPDDRLKTAEIDDPCYADALYMYGAGARAPGQEQALSGKLQIGRELVASQGRDRGNELVLLPRDLEGKPIGGLGLEISGIRLEPRV